MRCCAGAASERRDARRSEQAPGGSPVRSRLRQRRRALSAAGGCAADITPDGVRRPVATSVLATSWRSACVVRQRSPDGAPADGPTNASMGSVSPAQHWALVGSQHRSARSSAWHVRSDAVCHVDLRVGYRRRRQVDAGDLAEERTCVSINCASLQDASSPECRATGADETQRVPDQHGRGQCRPERVDRGAHRHPESRRRARRVRTEPVDPNSHCSASITSSCAHAICWNRRVFQAMARAPAAAS